jgi:hypothetical protein
MWGYLGPGDICDPAAWAALGALIAMEVVLGIDNLAFICVLTDKQRPSSTPIRVSSCWRPASWRCSLVRLLRSG